MVQAVLVLDVGKTHAKLTLVGLDGALIATRSRANAVRFADGRQVLDTDGIEAWLMATVGELAALTGGRWRSFLAGARRDGGAGQRRRAGRASARL